MENTSQICELRENQMEPSGNERGGRGKLTVDNHDLGHGDHEEREGLSIHLHEYGRHEEEHQDNGQASHYPQLLGNSVGGDNHLEEVAPQMKM